VNSYRDPEAQWLGTPNFTPDRDGHFLTGNPAIPGASYIVLHTMVGTWQAANARFQNASQQASAHYGVCLDGELKQWVDEKDAAWHAGDFGVNLDSIGIEHEDGGAYNAPRPDALYARSAKLVAAICHRYGLPCVRGDAKTGKTGIIDHRTVYATACPDALNTNRIIAEAYGILHPQPPPPPPPPPPEPQAFYSFISSTGDLHPADGVMTQSAAETLCDQFVTANPGGWCEVHDSTGELVYSSGKA